MTPDNTPTPQSGEKLVERAMDGFVWTPERKAEIEVIMKQWDAMAGYLKRGVHGSLPSDWFYDKAEDLVFLRSSLQEALERAEKAEAERDEYMNKAFCFKLDANNAEAEVVKLRAALEAKNNDQ